MSLSIPATYVGKQQINNFANTYFSEVGQQGVHPILTHSIHPTRSPLSTLGVCSADFSPTHPIIYLHLLQNLQVPHWWSCATRPAGGCPELLQPEDCLKKFSYLLHLQKKKKKKKSSPPRHKCPDCQASSGPCTTGLMTQCTWFIIQIRWYIWLPFCILCVFFVGPFRFTMYTFY